MHLGAEELRNMEVFKIWRLELWKVTYKSLLNNFRHTREIVRIKEIFQLCEVA